MPVPMQPLVERQGVRPSQREEEEGETLYLVQSAWLIGTSAAELN